MSYRRTANPRAGGLVLKPQALFAITRVRASVFARLRCVCKCVRACLCGRYTHGKQCVKGVYSGYLTLRLQMLCDPDQGSAIAADRIGPLVLATNLTRECLRVARLPPLRAWAQRASRRLSTRRLTGATLQFRQGSKAPAARTVYPRCLAQGV